jgi:dipeptidyl aminopeptidase/acylaminoacyl peptidase
VTSGAWEVTGVDLSPDRQTFYLTTSETHPGERAIYTVPVTGGARTRVTPLQGWTEGTLSYDGRTLALLHSTASTPPELYLMPARPGAQPVQVTESRTAEFRRGPWIRPEVVTFRASDGQTVYAASTARATWAQSPTGAGCSSSTARGTCRTPTAGGARTFASTCSTTCWPRAGTR